MKKIKYLGLATLLAFISCNKSNELVDITSKIEKDTGFIDLVLSISEKKETDSTFVYSAIGLYNSVEVGIEISLKKGIKAGIVNGEMKNAFVNKGISIKSVGDKSNKFLNSISELYGIPKQNLIMKSGEIILTCANLNDKDIDYENGQYKFKIFMETENDAPELFVNFDFNENQIQLNEKDTEYRNGIVDYLTKK